MPIKTQMTIIKGEIVHAVGWIDPRLEESCLFTSNHFWMLVILNDLDPLNECLNGKLNESLTWQDLYFLLPLVNSF